MVGTAVSDDHLVFAHPDGTAYHPARFTMAFAKAGQGGGTAEHSAARPPRAPRGAMYPGGVKGPAFGLSQQTG